MRIEEFVLIILYIISIFVALGINVNFFLRARKTELFYSFLLLQGVTLFWVINKVMVILSSTDEVAWRFAVLQYIGVCFMGSIFLDFAYFFNKTQRLKVPIRIILYGVSLINYLVFLTNPLHYHFFTEFTRDDKTYGVFFYVHTIYSYTVIILAYGYLFFGLFHSNNSMHKKNKILFSIGLILPTFVNVFHVFGMTPFNMDITPIMFNTTFIVFGYASYQFKFADIRNVARHVIFENMQEGIIIIDKNMKVVRCNPIVHYVLRDDYIIKDQLSFEQLINDSKAFTINYNEIIDKMNDFLKSNLLSFTEDIIVQTNKKRKDYLFKIQKILDKNQEVQYMILRFIEVTKYNKAAEDLKNKNRALETINMQLSEELIVRKKLAIAKERNRVSKELHDILGHSMTMVISLLEMSKVSVEKDKAFAKEKIIHTSKIIREGYMDLKKSLEGSENSNISVAKLCEDLENLAKEIKDLGTEVIIIPRFTSDFLEPRYYDAIYRMCQEGLTNAIRHGSAENITIGLRISIDHIDLIIADDGTGCKKFVKGNGLTGMEQRVLELNGTFSCGSPEGEGFTIHIKIPFIT